MKKIPIIILLFALVSCGKTYKIGYIDIKVVFNDFEYKKELEKELINIKNNRKFLLDSLETNLKIVTKKINLDNKNKDLIVEYQTLKEIYLEKREDIRLEEETMVRQFDEKIIKQLNSYVKSYGVENNYSMIYGATANGNIMYGDSALDLSKNITDYINKKYKGK
jgi:outer membrane protein